MSINSLHTSVYLLVFCFVLFLFQIILYVNYNSRAVLYMCIGYCVYANMYHVSA